MTNNDYSIEGRAAIVQLPEDHYEKDSNFLGEEPLNQKSGDYDYANLEQFWEPADQESGLKEQLFCLNIKEIPIEELELRIIHFANKCTAHYSSCRANSGGERGYCNNYVGSLPLHAKLYACNAIEDTGNLPFLTAIFQAHDLAHVSLKFKKYLLSVSISVHISLHTLAIESKNS